MKRKSSPLLPPVLGTVATRTRRQKKTAAAKWNQPLSVIINILMYADPETVRVLCRVSKQFLDIIRNSPGTKEHRVIPLLQIAASEFTQDEDRPERLIHQLYQHRAELQRYGAVKFIGVTKFCHPRIISDRAPDLPNTFQLHGVVSLDISSPTEIKEHGVYYGINALPHYLADILPNLLEINFSNTKFTSNSMRKFCRSCPCLEKIAWNNIKLIRSIVGPCLDGGSMFEAKNLKEIYMDNCEFYSDCSDYQQFTNLDGDPHSYIFHFYSKNKDLARLSIKNAVVLKEDYTGSEYTSSRSPRFEMKHEQDMLIKFVRKAPSSLKWFRSDLTQGNIDMLQSERPGIELVS